MSALLNRASRLPRIPKPCVRPPFVQARATLHHSSLLSTLRSRSSAKSTNTWTVSRLLYATGISGIGLGLTTCGSKVHCDTETPFTPPDLAPPPVSLVSFYELSFGTVTGVCAGVFIKKGVKAVAWLLGGIFILLQYLRSTSVIRVDWGRVASVWEERVYVVDSNGHRTAPTIGSVWRWLSDFLAADFQPRAAFLAGLALGLRIG